MTIGDQTTNNPAAPADARKAAAKRLAEQYGLTDPNPPPSAAPGMGDALLRKAGIDAKVRAASKQGRKSSFLTGAMGDVTNPILSEKKALGKY
jgi:hypothetical protein